MELVFDPTNMLISNVVFHKVDTDFETIPSSVTFKIIKS